MAMDSVNYCDNDRFGRGIWSLNYSDKEDEFENFGVLDLLLGVWGEPRSGMNRMVRAAVHLKVYAWIDELKESGNAFEASARSADP